MRMLARGRLDYVAVAHDSTDTAHPVITDVVEVFPPQILPVTRVQFAYEFAERDPALATRLFEESCRDQIRDMEVSGRIPAFFEAVRFLAGQRDAAEMNARHSSRRADDARKELERERRAHAVKMEAWRRIYALRRSAKPRLP
jgi:hypothetical protein